MPKNNQGFIPLMILFLAVVAILMFGASSFYLIHQIHLPTFSSQKASSEAKGNGSEAINLPKDATPSAVNSSLPAQNSPEIQVANPTPIVAVPTATPTVQTQSRQQSSQPPSQTNYSIPNYYVTQPTSLPNPTYQPIQSVPSTLNSGSTRQPSDLLSSGLLNVTITPSVPATISVYGVNVSGYSSSVGSISYQRFQSGTYKIHFSYQNTTDNGQYLRIPADQTIQIINHQTTNVSADFSSGTVQTSFLWAP